MVLVVRLGGATKYSKLVVGNPRFIVVVLQVNAFHHLKTRCSEQVSIVLVLGSIAPVTFSRL